MQNTMNAGFYLQYLWERRKRFPDKYQQLILARLSILSSFSVVLLEEQARDYRISANTSRLIAIYSNIISRGLPTLPSLLVERSILEYLKKEIPIREEEVAGAIRFTNGRMNRMVEEEWLKSLTGAHFFTSDRLQDGIKKTELSALIAVITPFAVARFQKVLLMALEKGTISLDDEQWKLVVVEREVPFAYLSLVDFLDHILVFQKLFGITNPLPQIELVIYRDTNIPDVRLPVLHQQLEDFPVAVEEVILGGDDPFDYYDGDLLIDLAVLSTAHDLSWNDDFAKRHLHSQGAAYVIRSVQDRSDKRQLRSQQPRPFVNSDEADEALVFFLQNIFRKREFREGQLEILRRATALRPVIGLLPTGAGKSLCYQLAALLQPGITLIIDPLLSLMADQMDNLSENYAIDWFGYISSQQTANEREQAARNMMAGEYLFVFISPERFQNSDFRSRLIQLTQNYSIPYAVIDEAHCVSEWGHDFRTSYLKLGKTITKYCRYNDQPPTIIALTGTASYAVLSDVQREIGVEEESAKVYPTNFERKELIFHFQSVAVKAKENALIQTLKGLPNLFQAGETFFTPQGEKTFAGIIFTPHVNGRYGAYPISKLVGSYLQTRTEFFSGEVPNEKRGRNSYHVMPEDEFHKYKQRVQREYKADQFPLLVATKAFGMGIDKPNIRYTIHYNIPQSLEAFYQEAGRAGRNREPAHCLVIFSDDKAEEADWMLQPQVTSREIRAALHNNWDVGDVHRLMFLFTNTYRGIDEEREGILELLTRFMAILSRNPYGKEVSFSLDFGTESQKQTRDKALYRLSILGIISDYTLDHNANKFNLTLIKLQDQEYIDNLQRYIKRYKTREVSDLVPDQVQKEPGANILEKCVSYLLKFVYQEIERKRRAAIKTMAEVARSASRIQEHTKQNKYVWEQMLAYLEHSPFTEDLLELSREINPDKWEAILSKRDLDGTLLLQSVDGVRQLLGGCRRALESDTDNPGLLFLTALARLLLPDPEIELAMRELEASLRFLEILPLARQEQACQEMYNQLNRWLNNTRDFNEVQKRYSLSFLKALPNRFVARMVHAVLPEESQNVLVNIALLRIHHLTENLFPDDQQLVYERVY